MTLNIERPEGFKDQAQLTDPEMGIYARDTLDLIANPVPVLGVSGEAAEDDDSVVEDKEETA